MSPELVDFDPEEGEVASTIASDVWALGCTLLEVSQPMFCQVSRITISFVPV